MTHLCVPIFVHSVEQTKRDVATAIEAGADMIELRLDLLQNEIDYRAIVDGINATFICTCRDPAEGGASALDDLIRVRRLIDASMSCGYADVELATLKRRPRDVGQLRCEQIVSAHDFSGRPVRLYNLIEEMNAAEAAVNKTVWTARTIRDNIEAFELLLARSKPTIAFCMGEAGLISRVLAKKFGAFLTFASLSSAKETAPGQVTIDEMKRLYRWDALGYETKVYGVVASPVAHSMSPAIHNAAFDQTGFDGVYLPLLVDPSYESFKAFMESFVPFEPLHLSGLSVTIPHKENALRYLQSKGAEVEDLAIRIGAVNTIVIDQGSLRGFNTDYAAILDSITSKLNIARDQLKEYRVAVLGAGGTGRTAVAALAEYGATVVVYNRTKERADALASEFDGRSGKVVSARLEKLCDSCCHIFINTTSVGMHPNVDASPLGEDPPQFTPDTVVFDTVYNPPHTKLLQQAQAAGARTIGGIEMFVRQATRQFELWTSLSAPTDVMRRVVEAKLTS